VGNSLNFANRLVRGSLHIDLPAAGQQSLYHDRAQFSLLVDRDDIVIDQLCELRIGVVSRRTVEAGNCLERRRLKVILAAQQAGHWSFGSRRSTENKVITAN